MRITYLIFAHNNPSFLLRLVDRLSTPNVDFMIHIDKKSNDDFSAVFQKTNVYKCLNSFEIEWGGRSMVDALLAACDEIVGRCKGDVIVFLSGSDYPVKSNDYIAGYLQKNSGMDFITGVPVPSNFCNWQENGRRRINCYALRISNRSIVTIEPRKMNIGNIKQLCKVCLLNPRKLGMALKLFAYPKRNHPSYLSPFGGEFWWVLPINTIKLILDFVRKHSDFLFYHSNTSNPDELFFNTLVYNLCEKGLIKNTCLRFVNWHKGNSSPANISSNDIAIIEKCIHDPDILFVRKIANIDTCDSIDCLLGKLK